MMATETHWKECSTCKRPITYSALYYLCSVTSCRHKRKGFRFCSVPCWDAHVAMLNHRDAWAQEAHAPSRQEYLASRAEDGSSAERAPVRKIVTPGTAASSGTRRDIKTETLVVVSKVKKLIKDQSGFSTSQCCIDALTEKVVDEAMKAVEHAEKSGRKTVMGRDVR